MRSSLLDTSALLAHHRNEEGADRVQALLEDSEATIHVSALSVAEMARRLTSLGAHPSVARSVALEYAQLADVIVPVDTAVAVRGFELGLLSQTRLPLLDALIAASAVIVGARLLHRDAHFESLGHDLIDQVNLSSPSP